MLTKHLRQSTQICLKLMKNMTFYSKVPEGRIDPIFGVLDSFMKCKDPKKVNLSIGTYKDDNGQPFVFECVKKAQKIIFDKNMDNEYPPLQGMPGFKEASLKLIYGENFLPLKENRIATIQTLSGSGAIRLCLELFQMFRSQSYVSIPAHTWPNHVEMPKQIRYPFKQYRYYDYHGLSFQIMKDDILNFDNESLILFHACSHNPTGVDISKEQWKVLRDIAHRKKLYVLIDLAYQGFTSGDPVEDAFAIRYFSEIPEIPLIVAQSYSKNMGMYGQRAGMLSIVTNSVKEQENITSQLKHLSRMSCSVPPIHGARIVETVLTTPDLYQLWLQELQLIAGRIKNMREQLVKNILKLGSTKDWNHIVKQQGMFAFTGLTKSQIARLAQDHNVYMTFDGRISVPGLNTKNVEYVARAFHNVTKSK